MLEEQKKITLGGQDFILSSLTLDQLQSLTDDMKVCDPLSKEGIAAIRRVLAIALADQISAEDIGKLKTTVEELWLAQQELSEVSGLRPLLERLAKRFASLSPGPTSTPPSVSIPGGNGKM